MKKGNNSRADSLTGIYSDVDSAAQITTLLQPVSEVERALSLFNLWRNSKGSSVQSVAAVIGLLLYSGMRISEVLRIKGTDITINRTLFYIASKSKARCSVQIVDSWDYYSKYVGKPVYLFAHFSRFYIYRQMKAIGLSVKFGANCNSSVTHLGRHITALNAQGATQNSKDAQRVLNHKSINSTKHYLTHEKKSK